MNYMSQLKQFHVYRQHLLVSSSAQLLWVTLMMENNACFWRPQLAVSNLRLCELMGKITEGSLRKARTELIELGLIEFFSSNQRGVVSTYRIVPLEKVRPAEVVDDMNKGTSPSSFSDPEIEPLTPDKLSSNSHPEDPQDTKTKTIDLDIHVTSLVVKKGTLEEPLSKNIMDRLKFTADLVASSNQRRVLHENCH